MDPVEDLIRKIQASPIRKHADAIGMVCVLWSQLELWLDSLLVALINTDMTSASALLTNLGMREKINTIRVIGYNKKPSQQWFDSLSDTLSNIDDKLRPDRNRVVHDYWLSSSETVIQLQHKARLVKPRPREIAVQYYEAKETSVGEIWALQIRIAYATGRIMEAVGDLYRSDVPTPSYDTDE